MTRENNEVSTGSDYIEKILWGFYKLECIHTSSFEYLKESDEFEITFDFRPYTRVIRPLEHISGNQIHEAIMEACYLVAAYLVESWKVERISLDDFLSYRAIAIFREVHIKFKKEIPLWNPHSLRFKVKKLQDLRWKFSNLELVFLWFAEWSCTSVLRSNDLVNMTLENK